MSEHVEDLALSRLIDGDLPTLSHEAVLDHLLHCPACAMRHEQLVEVAAALRGLPAVEWGERRTAAVAAAVEHRPGRHRSRPVVPAAAVLAAAVAVSLVVLVAWLGAFPLPAAAFGLSLKLTSALISMRAFAVVSEVAIVMLLVALAAPLAAYPLARWR